MEQDLSGSLINSQTQASSDLNPDFVKIEEPSVNLHFLHNGPLNPAAWGDYHY
jgi:hypothetical protein